MKVDYAKQMSELLTKVDYNVRKQGMTAGVRFGETEYNIGNRHSSIFVETNCAEYVIDKITDLIKKTKFEVVQTSVHEGCYDWVSDYYSKPYACVTIKAF